MILEPHYFRTSPECASAEECWKELGEYLEKHAQDRMVVFRDVPQVHSDVDFDTKHRVHVGYVRFNAGPVDFLTQERDIGFGNVECKA